MKPSARSGAASGWASVSFTGRNLRGVERKVEELSAMFSQAGAGIAQTDCCGRFIAVNEKYCEMVGRARGELRRLRMQDLTHPDDLIKDLPLFQRAVEAAESFVLEKRYLRPDGSVLWVQNAVTAITDGQGQVRSMLAVSIDLTEQKRIERTNRQLAQIVENSNDAIISKDANGIVASWNRGAERLFGFSAQEVVGMPITVIIPPDRLDEEPEILERIRRGERVEHFETVRRRKDGSLVDISLTVSPVKDENGRIIGASKIARDITERKLAQRHQKMMALEVQHRTKNLFAVVQAVVSKSFVDKKTVAEVHAAVMSRLQALAQTHVLLIDKEWNWAEFREIVLAEMAPYGDRVTIDGPAVRLSPKAAQDFSLLLHELATNAAKYGALSSAHGRVRVSWTAAGNGSAAFIFCWRELGGPPVVAPLKRGFGSTVLGHIMAKYCDEAPRIEYAIEGLEFRLTALPDALCETPL